MVRREGNPDEDDEDHGASGLRTPLPAIAAGIILHMTIKRQDFLTS